jgi:capsule biosynthesis phosphatase
MTIPDSKKTIVFDVDDTILTTVNRDYANSQPIVEVVNGLRALKKNGWYIILQTARGMGRSNGDIESVRAEVSREIEEFCSKYDVPYDELLLGKPWAAWYIDDKAMRPDEFASRYKSLLEAQ